ncbi:BTAD domain-containing putative transcriptional regulator [Nocardiopsis oceani]
MDWHRAQQWLDTARNLSRRGEHSRAAALLEDALDQWQGDPLSEFTEAWAQSFRRNTVGKHTRILGQWADVRLALGQHEEVADRLEGHPRDETLAFHHMSALIACGRHTEAVECYTELREHTLAELGSEPNPRTRNLFQRVLTEADRDDEASWAEPGQVSEKDRQPEVVDTLQVDVADFLGREDELEEILDSVHASEGRTVLQVVNGLGGAGKTTLALHAAHVLRAGFDVRLHTDLTDAGPDQVLFRLLQMLGVPGNSIPAEPEARGAMWRNQIAGRRVLLLLDNASHRSQVAPAIPGTPGSVVLVTSRRSLAGLDGARHVNLRALDEEDAARMFAAFTGRAVDAEGMDRVVGLAGRLPIALRVAAARLRRRPTWSLGHLADRLERQRREAVKGAEWEAIAVFAASFEELSPQTRRTFLCVGLHPAPVVPEHAVAASVGGWAGTESSLDELLDVHLLEEVSPGRYRMHDLVRQFAHQRAARAMSDRERWEVEDRILAYYLATVDKADRAARLGRRRAEHPIARGVATPFFPSPRAAREWFADHFPAVEAVIEHARERGFTEYAARIPLAMAGLLESNGPWDRGERLLEYAVEAWGELGDPLGQADGFYELALMRLNLMDKEGAEECLGHAIGLWLRNGGENEVPHARDQLAIIRALREDHVGAVAGYKAALAEFRRLRNQRGVAKVYSHMAISQLELGQRELADLSYTTARSLYQALGDSQFEATVTINLMQLRFAEGRHRDVREMSERSLQVFREHGDVSGVARARQIIGMLENYLGRHQQALDSFRAAYRAFWCTRDEQSMIHCTAGIGFALLGLGRTEEAQETLEQGLERVRAHRSPGPEAKLLRALGDVQASQVRWSAARWSYVGSRRVAERNASVLDEGLAHDRLGDLNSREGDTAQALECWQQAARILEPVPSPYLAEVLFKIRIATDTDLGQPG